VLTEEQLEQRRVGIGASEVPAIVGCAVPGRRTAVDVWLTKRRGKDLELDPVIAEPPPDPDTCDAFAPYVRGDVRTAGSILEAGIADLYAHMTGAQLELAKTERHPQHPWALATPDRYIIADGGRERGLEIKLVGSRMVHDWPEDGLPDYVRVQCLWGMHVTGLERWDVMALLGGSDPRIIRLERDDALISDVHEVVSMFWHEYVLANRMPEAERGDDAMRGVKALFRDHDDRVVPAPPEAWELAQELARAKADLADAQDRNDRMTALLCALTAEHRGIEDGWGKFLWYGRRGSVSWKGVALELSGGVVPDELIEKHRGEPCRVPRLYAAKEG